jgi:pyridoxamine 5'-phosphate oxidase family protein
VNPIASESRKDGILERIFSEKEAEYLAENYLGRLATVSDSKQPHVVPVAYRFDGTSIYFGGWNLERTLYFRNLTGNNKVGFVVDHIVSTDPWRVKGVEVRGRAEPERSVSGMMIVRIRTDAVRSWGLGE